jgi:hypothetical protein
LEYAALVEKLEREEGDAHRGEVRHLAASTDARSARPDLAPEPAVASRRSGWRWVVAAVGTVLVLAAGVVVTARTAGPTVRHTRSVSQPVPSESLQPSVDQGSFPAPTAAPSSTPVPLSVDGAAVVAQQSSGRGSAVVRIDPSSAPVSGAALFVSMAASDPSPVGWRVERRASRPNRASDIQVLAASAPSSRVGAAPTIVMYKGAAPTEIVVLAATGVTWTIRVAFVAAGAPGLR